MHPLMGSEPGNGWVIGAGTLTDQSDQAIAFFDTVVDAQRRELATKLQERADDLRQEAAGLRSLAERITSQWPEKGYLASSATHSAEQLAEAA